MPMPRTTPTRRPRPTTTTEQPTDPMSAASSNACGAKPQQSTKQRRIPGATRAPTPPTSRETAPTTTIPTHPRHSPRRDEALVPLIVGGARKLKRVLADEQNGVLDLLRQKQPVTQLDDLIGDLDEHVETYAAALRDELLDAAIAGAAEVGRA